MLTPWLELDGAAERMDTLSDAAGLDLTALGTTGDAEQIKDTAVTQPLVVALSVLVFEHLSTRVALPADTIVAGHSVGELTAAVFAGVLTAEDAVALAAVRGREMAAACALTPTGMSALLGGDESEVLEHLARRHLVPANRNGNGQVVAAGPLEALADLKAEPPQRCRVVPLAVAGAFHTDFMTPAREALATHADGVKVADPTRPLLSNADGGQVDDGVEVLRRLVAQVTSPVRWDACTATLLARGVTATVELPPAGTLTGLAKREMKGVTTLAVKTPADLERAVELIGDPA